MGAVIWEQNREGHKSVIEKSIKVMKQRIGGGGLIQHVLHMISELFPLAHLSSLDLF